MLFHFHFLSFFFFYNCNNQLSISKITARKMPNITFELTRLITLSIAFWFPSPAGGAAICRAREILSVDSDKIWSWEIQFGYGILSQVCERPHNIFRERSTLKVMAVKNILIFVTILVFVEFLAASPTRRQYVAITEASASASPVTSDGSEWDDNDDDFDVDGKYSFYQYSARFIIRIPI